MAPWKMLVLRFKQLWHMYVLQVLDSAIPSGSSCAIFFVNPVLNFSGDGFLGCRLGGRLVVGDCLPSPSLPQGHGVGSVLQLQSVVGLVKLQGLFGRWSSAYMALFGMLSPSELIV